MDQQLSNKDFITKLYVDEAEGTKNLYANTGFFMRMELWDKIHVEEWIELSEDCRQNVTKSREEAQNYYDAIIDEMNTRIKGMDIQLRGQMLFNRNFLQEKYSANPVRFVHAMAASFEQENQLISHYRNQLESQDSSKEVNPSIINYSEINESENLLKTFNTSLQSLIQCKSGNPGILIGGINAGTLPPENLRQGALDCLQKLIHSLPVTWEKVKDLIDNALQADAFRNVSLTPKYSISYDELSAICDRYAAVLHDLYILLHHTDYSWMLKGDKKFEEAEQTLIVLENNFFERNLIFIKHPKEVILVANNDKKGEKEIKTEAGAAGTSSKGKKGQKAPKEKCKAFDTKKKESIDAKIRILGFTKIRAATVVRHSLILTTEQHLASQEGSAQRWDFDGAHSPQPSNCGTIHPVPTELPCNGEAEFKNLKIEGYERASDSVYEQLVRLQYTVEVQAFDRTFTLKAFSLPFFLCTGAIQVLELLGSRMWYLANKHDLFHGDFQVITTLPMSSVINMLENRIMSTCPKRRRGLSYHGKEFLKEVIPEIDAQGNITLHAFIKDKMKVIPDKRNSTEEVKYQKFTFFAWFYAFVKSIENRLGLWHDGIIYDLFSYRDSCEYLTGGKFSSGCMLLRPGLSKVIKPNSVDAHIRFTIDMKVRSGGKWVVSTLPVDPASFEQSSLYSVISSSHYKDMKPKAICTYKGIVPMHVLKNYDDTKEDILIRYHNFLIQKTETLSIPSEGDQPHDVPEEDPDGPRKRKEGRHDSGSSFSEPLSVISSLGPPSAEPYDTRSTDTDFFLNADAVSPKSSTSDPERPNNSPSNDLNPIKAECPSNGNLQVFGDNTVDVTHLLQNNNAQRLSTSLLTQKSFESQPTTSPHPNQGMNYNCPEHDNLPSPENEAALCGNCSAVPIPTTVQEIGEENPTNGFSNLPVSFVYLQGMEPILHDARGLFPPPGWSEGDVMEALTDQVMPMV